MERLVVVHRQGAYLARAQVDAFVFEHLHAIPFASASFVELQDEPERVSCKRLVMQIVNKDFGSRQSAQFFVVIKTLWVQCPLSDCKSLQTKRWLHTSNSLAWRVGSQQRQCTSVGQKAQRPVKFDNLSQWQMLSVRTDTSRSRIGNLTRCYLRVLHGPRHSPHVRPGEYNGMRRYMRH